MCVERKTQKEMDMNKRYETVEQAEAIRRDEETVTLRIEGAWLEDSGDGQVTINLNGVKPVNIDWGFMAEHFKTQGVGEDDADFLMNKFANETEEHLLAKALAKRIKRVG